MQKSENVTSSGRMRAGRVSQERSHSQFSEIHLLSLVFSFLIYTVKHWIRLPQQEPSVLRIYTQHLKHSNIMGTTCYSSCRMFIFYGLLSLNTDLSLTITVPYSNQGESLVLQLLTIFQYNLSDISIFLNTKVYFFLSHTQQNAYLPNKLHIVHKCQEENRNYQ